MGMTGGRTSVTRTGKAGSFTLWTDEIGHVGKTFGEAIAAALSYVPDWMCRGCAGSGYAASWTAKTCRHRANSVTAQARASGADFYFSSQTSMYSPTPA